jgi:signal transduction histidine kinase
MGTDVAPMIPGKRLKGSSLPSRRYRKMAWEIARHGLRINLARFAVIVAVLYWVADALIHVFVLRSGPLIEQLFPNDPNELWMRTLIMALMVAFGVYAQHAVDRQRRLRREAETANRTKSEFLATMSHELRSPLNAIIGFSEIMKNETFGALGDPRYREYARDVLDSGTHLLEIINDLLDLSKIESGKLEICEEVVDIRSVNDTCQRLIKARAESASLRLATDLQPHLPGVYADPRKIKQVLLNLLSNAVKFTPEGGTVTTAARIDGGGRFVLSGADTGIGIAPENIGKAMSAFGQVDSSLSRRYQGTGLGLSLSKALVELHGGTLALESEQGVGTTVTVTLPPSRVLAREGALAADAGR